MKILTLGFALCFSILLFGCAAQKISVQEFNTQKPELICIAKNDQVKYNFLNVLQEGLAKNGSETRVVPANYQVRNKKSSPEIDKQDLIGCDALVLYSARWEWDFSMYMKNAFIRVTDPDMEKTIASIGYLSGNRASKFSNARETILKLVDQMYGVSTGDM